MGCESEAYAVVSSTSIAINLQQSGFRCWGFSSPVSVHYPPYYLTSISPVVLSAATPLFLEI